MCWKTCSETEGFPVGMARYFCLLTKESCDKNQLFLKNIIFCGFYCFKWPKNLIKNSKCNYWIHLIHVRSYYTYFPHIKTWKRRIQSQEERLLCYIPTFKNTKNKITGLINMQCTLTWVRSGMSPWSIPTCWVYKKRRKKVHYYRKGQWT